MSQSNYVHLEDCIVVKVTDKAALIMVPDADGGTTEWFPLSQIADGEGLKAGKEPVTVSITEWIAKQKGIEA